ncbi:MAG: hypothetical protein R6V27_15480 [Balneolaceae bacterium]
MKSILYAATMNVILLSLVSFMVFIPGVVQAQNTPDPKVSFLRSLVMPGWGHHYNDSENWNRGKVHFGAEAILIGSLFGLSARASNLENQYHTFAQLKAGIPVSGRDRTFQLAVGQYNSLDEYNDFQLRSRNWNQMLPDSEENRWNWQNEADRERYADLRESSDRARNQLPAIAGLMVVNRVVSAISAYRRARNLFAGPELSLLPAAVERGSGGIVAKMTFNF